MPYAVNIEVTPEAIATAIISTRATRVAVMNHVLELVQHGRVPRWEAFDYAYAAIKFIDTGKVVEPPFEPDTAPPSKPALK